MAPNFWTVILGAIFRYITQPLVVRWIHYSFTVLRAEYPELFFRTIFLIILLCHHNFSSVVTMNYKCLLDNQPILFNLWWRDTTDGL